MWYTLVRFNGTPKDMTGISQTKTAHEALSLLDAWEESFPDETSVVFDPKNQPLQRSALTDLAAQQRPADAPV